MPSASVTTFSFSFSGPRRLAAGLRMIRPSSIGSSKIKWSVERQVLTLEAAYTAANTHDSLGLKPMIEGHQTRHDPHCGRFFKPRRLHADKAYDVPLRKWLWGKHIGVRIARKASSPANGWGAAGGHRTHHVLADRLPPTQPPLRTPSPQLPGLPRPRSRPLLLRTTPSTHHMGHGLGRRLLYPTLIHSDRCFTDVVTGSQAFCGTYVGSGRSSDQWDPAPSRGLDSASHSIFTVVGGAS